MLGQILHLNGVEATQPAVYGDKREVNTTYLQTLQQLTTEVQTRSRSRYSTLVAGIDGLEILHVVGCCLTVVNDIVGQGSRT